MAEFDSEVADISVILDAYMYLNYQSDTEDIQGKNLNQLLKDTKSEYKDSECYKVLKKAL